jgi:hypothetical protein
MECVGNWVEINKVTALQGTESLFLDGLLVHHLEEVLGQPLGVLWGGKFCNRYDGTLILTPMDSQP